VLVVIDNGVVAVVCGPSGLKCFGRTSLGPFLAATGLALRVIVDEPALEKMRPRLKPRHPAGQAPALNNMLMARARKRSRFLGDLAFGKRMWAFRMMGLSPKRRSASARKAAKARWRKPRVTEARP
jgi:hypothetical protein